MVITEAGYGCMKVHILSGFIYILSSTLKDKNVQNKPGKKDQALGIMFLTGEFHNMTQDWKML